MSLVALATDCAGWDQQNPLLQRHLRKCAAGKLGPDGSLAAQNAREGQGSSAAPRAARSVLQAAAAGVCEQRCALARDPSRRAAAILPVQHRSGATPPQVIGAGLKSASEFLRPHRSVQVLRRPLATSSVA